jgi:hypothetical protein
MADVEPVHLKVHLRLRDRPPAKRDRPVAFPVDLERAGKHWGIVDWPELAKNSRCILVVTVWCPFVVFRYFGRSMLRNVVEPEDGG